MSILDIFRDTKGKWSNMRIMTAFVVVSGMAGWIVPLAISGNYVEPGVSLALLVGGALGGKAAQRITEGAAVRSERKRGED